MNVPTTSLAHADRPIRRRPSRRYNQIERPAAAHRATPEPLSTLACHTPTLRDWHLIVCHRHPGVRRLAVVRATAARQDDAATADRIDQLVEQLNADEAAQREAAEKAAHRARPQGRRRRRRRFLDQLPKPNDHMPQEVQTRLARIASEVRSRLAKQAVDATRLTLDVKEAPLDEVLKAIEKQTGNRITDHREQFGQEAMAKKVTLKVDDEPFWSGLRQVPRRRADAALRLLRRGDARRSSSASQGALRRSGRGAVYAGPFRIEATSVTAERGLRTPDQSSLRLDLEIAWEPRLKPIALTQAAGDVKAIARRRPRGPRHRRGRGVRRRESKPARTPPKSRCRCSYRPARPRRSSRSPASSPRWCRAASST